jgi:polygalacturonase
LVALLLLCGVQVAWAGEQKRVNVLTAGLVGDGATDNTAALRAAIAANGSFTTYYFPPGTYSLANVDITGLSSITLEGDGPTSILQYREPASSFLPILTFNQVDHITIHHLAIDNKHILSYGGVRFYNATYVTLEENTVYDSDPRPVSQTDCYGFVFGQGTVPHHHIVVRNNTFRYLQLELDGVTNAHVVGNVSYASRRTAAIGFFTLGDGALFDTILVEDNIVIDAQASGQGIVFALDPPASNHNVFRNITVQNNTIVRSQTNGGFAIAFGTTYLPQQTTGNSFSNITVRNNRVQYMSSQTYSVRGGLLRMLSNGDFAFTNVTVERNDAEDIVDLRFLVQSYVAYNSVLHLGFVSPAMTEVAFNNGHATTAYQAFQLDWSRGRNYLHDNWYIGPIGQGLMAHNPLPSDILAQPLRLNGQ